MERLHNRYAFGTRGVIDRGRKQRQRVVDMNELWLMPRDCGANVAIGGLTPNRSLREGQTRKGAHLIVVNRMPHDFMASRFQQSRLISYDQVLASRLLIEVVNL
jgi:hypothetical protein